MAVFAEIDDGYCLQTSHRSDHPAGGL